MQEWVSTSVHSSTSRRGPPRTTSSSVPPQLRRTYYAERTARGFPFPRDFRHTGEFAPAASQAHSFPAQPTRLLTPNTYIRPISNTYIRPISNTYIRLTRFTHSQLTAQSKTPLRVSWRVTLLSLRGSADAGERRLLCVNNSFHSKPKLLSSRVWGANPTHPQ
jgi:hypothetical protein